MDHKPISLELVFWRDQPFVSKPGLLKKKPAAWFNDFPSEKKPPLSSGISTDFRYMYTICFSHFPWISQLFAHISNDLFLYFSPYFTWISHLFVSPHFPWISHVFHGFSYLFLTFPRDFPWISHMDFPWFSTLPGLPARPGRTARLQRVPLRGQALRGDAEELCMVSSWDYGDNWLAIIGINGL